MDVNQFSKTTLNKLVLINCTSIFSKLMVNTGLFLLVPTISDNNKGHVYRMY